MRDDEVRFDERTGKAGIYTATWGLRLPWAHPCWPEYLAFLYDLKPHPGAEPPKLLLPDATHEFLLVAADPATPIDFYKDLYDQQLRWLSPANVGYQFAAASDVVAKARIETLVQAMLRRSLSPDTDFRSVWDQFFRDGASLVTRVSMLDPA